MDAKQALEAAARLAEGQVVDRHYRTWPWWGTGSRGKDTQLVKFCDELAKQIRALEAE